jgi:RNA polymerase sigma-70 factor (ECF subfamily)
LGEPTREIDEGVSPLIEGARAGDEAAFEDLVRRYYERIHRWALARTGDRDDADDVTQEVLVRLHRHIRRFDGRSRFSTWLYRLTLNAAADLHRKAERRRRLARRLEREPPPAPRAAEDAAAIESDEGVDLVRTFMEALSDRQRQVFDLVDLQGLSPVEVAEMLGTEPATVRSHLFRARRAIRRRILESRPDLVEGHGD